VATLKRVWQYQLYLRSNILTLHTNDKLLSLHQKKTQKQYHSLLRLRPDGSRIMRKNLLSFSSQGKSVSDWLESSVQNLVLAERITHTQWQFSLQKRYKPTLHLVALHCDKPCKRTWRPGSREETPSY